MNREKNLQILEGFFYEKNLNKKSIKFKLNAFKKII